MLFAFCSRRPLGDQRIFFKLDCWHARLLPLFHRAFPAVSWLFLYRDPVEVLVSQKRRPGIQMVSNMVPPEFYGLDSCDVVNGTEYHARVVDSICRAALHHSRLGKGLFVNYRELPEAFWTRILPHFGVIASEQEREAMLRVTKIDVKAPFMPFSPDGAGKQQEATDALRRIAEFVSRRNLWLSRAHTPGAIHHLTIQAE